MSTVNESAGLPVSVGRTQRTVPERTRRLVILRYRGCCVPGCTADQFLHVHHVIHWDPDYGTGPTDTFESRALMSATPPPASPRPARDLRQRRRPATG